MVCRGRTEMREDRVSDEGARSHPGGNGAADRRVHLLGCGWQAIPLTSLFILKLPRAPSTLIKVLNGSRGWAIIAPDQHAK